MNYELICIDMDGTLLNDKNEITKENEEILKKCLKNNIKIAITTGRIYGSAKEYCEKININPYIYSI